MGAKDISVVLHIEQDLPTRILATGDFHFLTNWQRVANITLEDKPSRGTGSIAERNNRLVRLTGLRLKKEDVLDSSLLDLGIVPGRLRTASNAGADFGKFCGGCLSAAQLK